MLEALAGSVFVGLILAGTVAICYGIMLKLLLPKLNRNFYIFVPCDKDSRNIRSRIYGLRLKLNLMGCDAKSRIVVIDCGILPSEKEELLEICKECNKIYLVKKGYTEEFFNGRI